MIKIIKIKQGSIFEGKGYATYKVQDKNFKIIGLVKFENINLRAVGVQKYIDEKLYESFRIDEDVYSKRLLTLQRN